ncbi:MAG: glutamate-1-semialdehyde 2,1-aminomutase [Anaerolineales bacterium]|nr:glutamate-1-semialdehyde 2,1-aminomutase [Anaerolineales bacterium]
MTYKINQSIALFNRAQTVLPGGVDSPARAFAPVGGQPLFIARGEGAYMIDVDGNRYVDYVLSFGPLIRGHAHPAVVAALAEVAAKGTSFGAPSPLELELAELIMSFMPQIEMIRFVNSGTEATMSALRLARAYTGRDKIIKFQGNYHGHADMLLVQAGSGLVSLGLPDTPGVPAATVANTLVAPYNDLTAVETLFEQYPDQIAAIIVEPVAGNMGVVPPAAGYLQGLRDITAKHGALLIFDEVMTGFRVHPGGAQTLYGITPDLTALGKVIGGGLPVGAYGGKREIMQMVAPAGPMYQAGTLSGNPLAMMGGLATLRAFQEEAGLWQTVADTAVTIQNGLADLAQSAGVPLFQTRVGTMMCNYFTNTAVTDYATATQANTTAFATFFHTMLRHGVYLPPSQFEAYFLSTAHGATEIDITLSAAEKAFRHVQEAQG